MAEDRLAKGTSGAGTSAIRNFKDLFPNNISTLYVYKGSNLVSKGNEVFAREDDLSIIALEELGSIDAIFGGEVFAVTPNTIEEEKTIKEIELEKFSTAQLTALMEDIEIDLTQPNLFYTIDEPFVQGDINEKRLDVFVDQQLIPGTLKKLVAGVTTLNEKQKKIASGDTVTFTLVPADTQNNMPSSKIRFVDADVYKPLPTESDEFEITSIDIESDQSLALEYHNGVKGNGIIENQIGLQIEDNIDFKMDKPLMPLQIKPYAKNGNVQFEIQNFNYFQRMPFLSAKHFLSNDRSVVNFIIGTLKKGDADYDWANDLASAIINMFIMSWAISTGYSAYDTDKDSIGGVKLKTMVGKDPEKLFPYVDQILRNWEYKNNVKNKNTVEYKRALQVLAASSEVLQSSYCVGKGLTEFHKSIFDYWLNINTIISESITDIKMTLTSNKYVFTYETDANGLTDFSKPIINLAPILDSSKVFVTNYGRPVSLSELDDPININAVSSFAGDIDPTKSDATKYFIGIDVTSPDKIASFLVNDNVDIPSTEKINYEFESSWYGGNADVFKTKANLKDSQQYDGSAIINSGQTLNAVDGSDTLPPPTFTDAQREQLIRNELNVPANAHNIKIDLTNVNTFVQVTNAGAVKYNFSGISGELVADTVKTSLVRFTGVVVTYDISTRTHGVIDKQQNYDKASFLNMVLQFSGNVVWKRNFTLSDTYRDTNKKLIAKIKSIKRLNISMFEGNYVDIKLNYKYKGTDGKTVTGTTLLPRITLPSESDETRTKIGIRL